MRLIHVAFCHPPGSAPGRALRDRGQWTIAQCNGSVISPARDRDRAEQDISRLREIRLLSTLLRRREQERSEEHTSELQSLMRNSYAVSCLKKTTQAKQITARPTSKTSVTSPTPPSNSTHSTLKKTPN